ncbi:MAG TPA: hypothetical protein PKI54_00430 [Bacteroidia bacterium]|nr:hypothetical protein [Bacteroidia bacterium]HMY62691.1 hypothetical protein [Bacteroidia bacterium]HNB33041.1 hypothetical protein [Bacteroidia bacterium]HNC33403.1 hypothetical protein [Bacteroidia bacterium]HNL03276.1 hypothetical protein [Bacteroidia bacterium]
MMPVMDVVEVCRVVHTMPALNKTIKTLSRNANELSVVDATIAVIGGL